MQPDITKTKQQFLNNCNNVKCDNHMIYDAESQEKALELSIEWGWVILPDGDLCPECAKRAPEVVDWLTGF